MLSVANRPDIRRRRDFVLWSTECQPRKTPIVTYGKETPPIGLAQFLRNFYVPNPQHRSSRLGPPKLFASPALRRDVLPPASGPCPSDGDEPHWRYDQDEARTVNAFERSPPEIKDVPGVSVNERSDSIPQQLLSSPLPGQLDSAGLIIAGHSQENIDHGVSVKPTTKGASQDTIESAPRSPCGNKSTSTPDNHRSGHPTPLTTLRRRLKSVHLVPRNVRSLQDESPDPFTAPPIGDGFSKHERILTYRLKPRQQPLRLRTNPSARSKVPCLTLHSGPLPEVKFAYHPILPVTPPHDATGSPPFTPTRYGMSSLPDTRTGHADREEMIRKELSSIRARVRLVDSDEDDDSQADFAQEGAEVNDNRGNYSEGHETFGGSSVQSQQTQYTGSPAASEHDRPIEPIVDTFTWTPRNDEDDLIMLEAIRSKRSLEQGSTSLVEVPPGQHMRPWSPTFSLSSLLKSTPELCGIPGPPLCNPLTDQPLSGDLESATSCPPRQRSILKNTVNQQYGIQPGSTAENTRHNRCSNGDSLAPRVQQSRYFAGTSADEQWDQRLRPDRIFA